MSSFPATRRKNVVERFVDVHNRLIQFAEVCNNGVDLLWVDRDGSIQCEASGARIAVSNRWGCAYFFFAASAFFAHPKEKLTFVTSKPLPKKQVLKGIQFLHSSIPPKTNMTTKQQHFWRCISSQKWWFSIVACYCSGRYLLACFIFCFLVVLAIQVGFTEGFGRDSAICRERGVHGVENTCPGN